MNLSAWLVLGLFVTVTAPAPALETAALQPMAPVELKGTRGSVGFLAIDGERRRLLVAHPGSGSLDVVGLDSRQLVASIPVGTVRGVAIDARRGRYLVGCGSTPQFSVIDAAKLAVVRKSALPHAAAGITYDPQYKRALITSAAQPGLWIVDPESAKVVQTNPYPPVTLGGFCLDQWGTAILQLWKSRDVVARCDFIEGKIPETWPTAPVRNPSALALAADLSAVLVAGDNGSLTMMSLHEDSAGKVIGSAPIVPRVVAVAYDPDSRLAYALNGSGKLCIVRTAPEGVTALATVSVPAGGAGLAVDPKNHAIWISYTQAGKACAQAFSVNVVSAGSH